MVAKYRLNPSLGLKNSGRWSLYTSGLYIQLNFIEKNALGGPGSGLLRQVVSLYRWCLAQVRLYIRSEC